MSDKLKKVSGYPDYSISVTCPHCNHEFDAAKVESEFGESGLTDAMFANTTESCTDMDYEIECPECEKEFIIDKLEY